MKRRTDIPAKLADQLMLANRRTCCVCRQPKHIVIHHIDGDPANNSEQNLAVLCHDCHSRVSGDEGLGRRFTSQEVLLHKLAWEQICRSGDSRDACSAEPLTLAFLESLMQALSGDMVKAALKAHTPEGQVKRRVLLLYRSLTKTEQWTDSFVTHLRSLAAFLSLDPPSDHERLYSSAHHDSYYHVWCAAEPLSRELQILIEALQAVSPQLQIWHEGIVRSTYQYIESPGGLLREWTQPHGGRFKELSAQEITQAAMQATVNLHKIRHVLEDLRSFIATQFSFKEMF